MNQNRFSDSENRGDQPENPPLADFETDLSEVETNSKNDDQVSQISGNEPIEAELVETKAGDFRHLEASSETFLYPQELPNSYSNEFSNMASIGGAVGSVVLGAWSILSALITYFAFINSILAVVLGIYGLNSRRRLWAIVGIVLGAVGFIMSMMEVNQMLSNFFVEEEF